MPFSVWWNLIVLPEYRERGEEADARVVEWVRSSSERDRMDTLVVTHQPEAAGRVYRHWLRSAATTDLYRDLELGERIPIIYLPGEPEGRALLAADFDYAHQSPIHDPRFATGALALFALSFGTFVYRRRLGVRHTPT